MSKKKKDAAKEEVPFFKRPSKVVLVIFTSLWALATFLILAAASDAFTEPLFPMQSQFYLWFALVLYNTWAVFILYRNYFLFQKKLRDEAEVSGKGKKTRKE